MSPRARSIRAVSSQTRGVPPLSTKTGIAFAVMGEPQMLVLCSELAARLLCWNTSLCEQLIETTLHRERGHQHSSTASVEEARFYMA